MAATSAPRVNQFDIQPKTFTRWCNEHLKERGMHIDNLCANKDIPSDLSNGILLINLLEIITHPKKVNNGVYNRHPRIPIQKIENVGIAIKFLEAENIKLVNIGPEDI